LRPPEQNESMDQGRNTRQASRDKHQCSEEAILGALELGMHCDEDGQRPENSNLSIEEEIVSDSITRYDMEGNENCAHRDRLTADQ
jgi:hypothetical protein